MGLLYDRGADPLDDVELVTACEDSFDVEIPDADAEKIRKLHTMQDVTDFISKLRKGGN